MPIWKLDSKTNHYMKEILLFSILAASIYVYFHDPSPADSAKAGVVQASRHNAAAPDVIVAPAPSSYARWKTGPTAQNDWKSGPNAQTDFAPFAPNEQAGWNDTPGYTIISGPATRR